MITRGSAPGMNGNGEALRGGDLVSVVLIAPIMIAALIFAVTALAPRVTTMSS